MIKAENTDLNWSETRLQQEIVLWYNNTYKNKRKLFFAVPNGGHRNAFEGAILKSEGVIRGVSDMILAVAGGPYFIELKKPDGSNNQSDEQKEFQKQIENEGFIYVLKNDIEDLKKFIINAMSISDEILL